jgi:hypothetical protein
MNSTLKIKKLANTYYVIIFILWPYLFVYVSDTKQ